MKVAIIAIFVSVKFFNILAQKFKQYFNKNLSSVMTYFRRENSNIQDF